MNPEVFIALKQWIISRQPKNSLRLSRMIQLMCAANMEGNDGEKLA